MTPRASTSSSSSATRHIKSGAFRAGAWSWPPTRIACSGRSELMSSSCTALRRDAGSSEVTYSLQRRVGSSQKRGTYGGQRRACSEGLMEDSNEPAARAYGGQRYPCSSRQRGTLPRAATRRLVAEARDLSPAATRRLVTEANDLSIRAKARTPSGNRKRNGVSLPGGSSAPKTAPLPERAKRAIWEGRTARSAGRGWAASFPSSGMQVIAYDPRSGNVAQRSVPVSEGTPESALFFDVFDDDAVGRPVRHTTPRSAVGQTSYDALRVEVTDPLLKMAAGGARGGRGGSEGCAVTGAPAATWARAATGARAATPHAATTARAATGAARRSR
jgi:hypothetical protein